GWNVIYLVICIRRNNDITFYFTRTAARSDHSSFSSYDDKSFEIKITLKDQLPGNHKDSTAHGGRVIFISAKRHVAVTKCNIRAGSRIAKTGRRRTGGKETVT